MLSWPPTSCRLGQGSCTHEVLWIEDYARCWLDVLSVMVQSVDVLARCGWMVLHGAAIQPLPYRTQAFDRVYPPMTPAAVLSLASSVSGTGVYLELLVWAACIAKAGTLLSISQAQCCKHVPDIPKMTVILRHAGMLDHKHQKLQWNIKTICTSACQKDAVLGQ